MSEDHAIAFSRSLPPTQDMSSDSSDDFQELEEKVDESLSTVPTVKPPGKQDKHFFEDPIESIDEEPAIVAENKVLKQINKKYEESIKAIKVDNEKLVEGQQGYIKQICELKKELQFVYQKNEKIEKRAEEFEKKYHEISNNYKELERNYKALEKNQRDLERNQRDLEKKCKDIEKYNQELEIKCKEMENLFFCMKKEKGKIEEKVNEMKVHISQIEKGEKKSLIFKERFEKIEGKNWGSISDDKIAEKINLRFNGLEKLLSKIDDIWGVLILNKTQEAKSESSDSSFFDEKLSKLDKIKEILLKQQSRINEYKANLLKLQKNTEKLCEKEKNEDSISLGISKWFDPVMKFCNIENHKKANNESKKTENDKKSENITKKPNNENKK